MRKKKKKAHLSSGRLLPATAQSSRQVELEWVAPDVDSHGARRVNAYGRVEGAPHATKGGVTPVECFAVQGEEDVGAVVAAAVVKPAAHHIAGAESWPASAFR